MTIIRRRMFTAFLLIGAAAAAAPATAQSPLAFDVASIKLAPLIDPRKIAAGQMRMGMRVDPSRVEIDSLTLADLINIAFRVKAYQVAGPEWLTASVMNADRFTIRATLPPGASTAQVPEMLQALLVERFKLEFHREDREQSVFALVPGRRGPKLKEAPPDPAAPSGEPPPTPSTPGAAVVGDNVQVSGNPQTGMTVRGGPTGTTRMTMGADGLMRIEAERLTLAGLADTLSRFVDRPVVDMTELKGVYTIALEVSQSDLMNMARSAGIGIPAGAIGPGGASVAGAPATAAADPGGVSILRSLDDLGLKLDPRKMAISKIIIDRLERRPTED